MKNNLNIIWRFQGKLYLTYWCRSYKFPGQSILYHPYMHQGLSTGCNCFVHTYLVYPFRFYFDGGGVLYNFCLFLNIVEHSINLLIRLYVYTGFLHNFSWYYLTSPFLRLFCHCRRNFTSHSSLKLIIIFLLVFRPHYFVTDKKQRKFKSA